MEGRSPAFANEVAINRKNAKFSHEKSHGHSPAAMVIIYVPIMALVGCIFILWLHRVWSRYQESRRCKLMNRFNYGFCPHRPSRVKTILNRHLLYAPLFERRHNREFRICQGRINMGTIPTRVETLLITCYITLNVGFCALTINWSQTLNRVLQGLIGTSGTLAIINMVPLVITAGRNNPLIPILKLSFDTFNLVHRWLGRIVVFEAVVHTVAVLIHVGISKGWNTVPNHLFHIPIFTLGSVGTIAFIVILFQSLSPMRHAFYEFFLHFHIALVTVSLVTLWHHLRNFVQKWILLAGIIAWALDRLLRLAIILWRNCGTRLTSATIQPLPGDVVRVDVNVIRPWKFKAGQYMYLYIPALGLWTSHPFSVAWESTNARYNSSHEMMEWDMSGSRSFKTFTKVSDRRRQHTISFLIRKRDGFSKKILKSAGLKYDCRRKVVALVEGPFGAIHSFNSYGSTVLIAGGIGITHSISHLRELIDGFERGSIATRRIALLWVVRSIDHLQWIQPWMTSILNHPALQGSIRYSNATPSAYSQNPYSLPGGTFIERTLTLSINIHLTTYYSSNNLNAANIDPLPARYPSIIRDSENRTDFSEYIAPAHLAEKTKSEDFPVRYTRSDAHRRQASLTNLSRSSPSSSSSTLNKTIDQYCYEDDHEKVDHCGENSNGLNAANIEINTDKNNTTTSTARALDHTFQDWTQLSSSRTPVTINLGKPLFRKVLQREIAQQIGAMAVSVCGPGGMGDEVRNAVREVQGQTTVEFFEESFSW